MSRMNSIYGLSKKLLVLGGIGALLLALGCGKQPASGPPSQAVAVKAMQVIQQDTPVNYEFVGEVAAKEEVQLRAKVSGNLVAKMVSGGATVYAGQPLFKIDRRQYDSAYLNNQAQLAESEAALSRIRRDVVRYQSLASQQAVAQQVLDNVLAEERQAIARVEANQARVQQAENDLDDTVLVSPLDGRIDIKDPSIGTFVQAGQTVLATISSLDPIQVRFSMSENEYLHFAMLNGGSNLFAWGQGLKLILSDGTEYPIQGTVDQVDRGMSQEAGTLTLKAVFANPNRLLVPGMFARVVAQGELRQGALLVPQRAVQEMLGKTFVTVVGEGDKAESRPVKMGPRVGNLWIVEEGLQLGERVVVEGFLKAQPGTPLKVTMMGPDELTTAGQK